MAKSYYSHGIKKDGIFVNSLFFNNNNKEIYQVGLTNVNDKDEKRTTFYKPGKIKTTDSSITWNNMSFINGFQSKEEFNSQNSSINKTLKYTPISNLYLYKERVSNFEFGCKTENDTGLFSIKSRVESSGQAVIWYQIAGFEPEVVTTEDTKADSTKPLHIYIYPKRKYVDGQIQPQISLRFEFQDMNGEKIEVVKDEDFNIDYIKKLVGSGDMYIATISIN